MTAPSLHSPVTCAALFGTAARKPGSAGTVAAWIADQGQLRGWTPPYAPRTI